MDTAARTQTGPLALHGIGQAAICCKLESPCQTIVILTNNHTTTDTSGGPNTELKHRLGQTHPGQTEDSAVCSILIFFSMATD